MVIDQARKEVIEQLFETNTFNKSFDNWKNKIKELVGDTPTPTSILGLDASLRDIFISTGDTGRDQSSLSGGGAAWEGLVCYYLNLCLIGTNTVVFKKRSHVPKCIQDALTVKYRNVEANSEADLVGVTFTDSEHLTSIPLAPKEKLIDRINFVASSNMKDLKVTIVQCKTNWNDNAQIPMLWDMVYQAKKFDDDRVSLGRNNTYLEDLGEKSLRYAFVTVPSNKLELFKDSSIAVKRVSELTGGNYWGKKSAKGIAQSLGEIFSRTELGPNKGRGVKDSLNANISRLKTDYSYFKL